MPKRVHIEGVGEVLLERSPRARNVCLSVRPFEGARVAVPPGVSFDFAEQVARRKSSWLRRVLERLAPLEQRALAAAARPLDESAARRSLAARLEELARRHGFRYRRVSIRRQKTRWGSCSAADDIQLNIQLARLPAALRDYVMLHELVHTRVKDHGQRFWDELTALAADARALDRRLDDHRHLLFLARRRGR